MEFGGRNGKNSKTRIVAFYGLIIVDIILITYAMIHSLPPAIDSAIDYFDFIVCIILMAEWILGLYYAPSRSEFLKSPENWIMLIASIPFDVIIPSVIPNIALLRYLRLLKLLRIIVLFNRFYEAFTIFLKKSRMDKIIAAVIITIIVFTILLWLYGPTYDLMDDFYFVIVTLTTVGYGDVTPHTLSEKIITWVLIFVGVLVFSTITAAISSYFTDNLMDSDDDEIERKLDSIEKELDLVHRENEDLKKEIIELKNLIKNE